MVLEPEGRVHEIARIMGGENPSVLLLETAREELRRWQDDLLPEREDGQET
jgi:DNA repair ATPase RecN